MKPYRTHAFSRQSASNSAMAIVSARRESRAPLGLSGGSSNIITGSPSLGVSWHKAP